MIPKFSWSIVDRLVEHLIVLGAQCEVHDFNSAASPLLRQFIEKIGLLRSEVTVAASNKSGLPCMLGSVRGLELSGRRLQALLCECGDGFAIIFFPDLHGLSRVCDLASGESTREADRGFYALVNTELRQEIGDLRVKLEYLAVHHPEACAELQRPLRRVASVRSVLDLLSELFPLSKEGRMERFSFVALLGDVLMHTPGLHGGVVNTALRARLTSKASYMVVRIGCAQRCRRYWTPFPRVGRRIGMLSCALDSMAISWC